MKQKRKLFLRFILLLCFNLSFYPLFARAQNVSAIFSPLAKFLVGIVAVIGVIMIILSGYYMVTAEGDPGKIEKSRQSLLWGIIGIGMAVIAIPLVNALLNFLSH